MQWHCTYVGQIVCDPAYSAETLQCDQIELFFKSSCKNLLAKGAKIFAVFWGYFVNITFEVKTAVATFWAIFDKFGLLFIPTSGHTEVVC